uniref:NusG domain II-containing protein n=1 Tax=Eubacterium cellulosolvens TaxID=29322 RepID=UPI000684EAD7|nr:NusG domain II-containing protein [[Eubacterium] cellulosolvens]
MKKTAGRNDIILIASILLVAGLILLVRSLVVDLKRPQLEILVNNEQYGVYDLDRDQEIRIGHTNVCEIKDGKVRMKEATCPDHLCMQFLPIDERGGSIICLPNQVILHVINAKETDDGEDNWWDASSEEAKPSPDGSRSHADSERGSDGESTKRAKTGDGGNNTGSESETNSRVNSRSKNQSGSRGDTGDTSSTSENGSGADHRRPDTIAG